MITINHIQEWVAKSTVGISTVRGQPAGTMQVGIDFIKKINLSDFRQIPLEKFEKTLDSYTNGLADHLTGKSWGISRKILNLFLIQAFHDKYLSEVFLLEPLKNWLELPIDGPTANRLIESATSEDIILPEWSSLRYLDKDTNSMYQEYGQILAENKRCARYQLELIW
jgi:hypothetical protein